jgi:hypothetical protein
MSDTSSSETKHEFDLHVTHLIETHKAFIDNSGKVAGFLLLALGWFVTSKDARAFLGSNPNVATLAASAVTTAYLLSVGASWVAYRVSTKTLRRLNQLAYLPPPAYEARVLGLATFVVCAFGNGVLAALLATALLIAPQ